MNKDQKTINVGMIISGIIFSLIFAGISWGALFLIYITLIYAFWFDKTNRSKMEEKKNEIEPTSAWILGGNKK